ncbi:segregation and condensation protein A [Candidatus Margulisiibacteriota bacterium]
MKTDIYNIKTETYEGPFDLLMAAIKEGRIDVYDVSLSKITLEYLAYLRQVSILNLNHAAEFMLMLACLVEMKSKKLLPQPPVIELKLKEEELELDLAKHIQEYNVYKQLAHKLRGHKETFARIYSRYHFNEKKEASPIVKLKGVSLEDLVSAFQRVWEEAREEEEIKAITDDPVTLPERIEEIRVILSHSSGRIHFEKLFIRRTRLEIVVTFLAILELTRQNYVNLIQGEEFGEIYIGLSENEADN